MFTPSAPKRQNVNLPIYGPPRLSKLNDFNCKLDNAMFRRDRTSEIKLKYNKLKVKVGEFMCYTLLSTLQKTPNETNPSYPPWGGQGSPGPVYSLGKTKVTSGCANCLGTDL